MAAPGPVRNLINSRTTAHLPKYVAVGVVLVALAVLAAGAGSRPRRTARSGSAAALLGYAARARRPRRGRQVRQRAPRRDRRQPASARTDSTPVEVLVKLDYDSVATYSGQVEGLAATSPATTGKALSIRRTRPRATSNTCGTSSSASSRAWTHGFPQQTSDAAARRLWRRGADRSGNEVGDLLKIPGVVAVQDDSPEQLLTDSSPTFIGASTIYGQLGGNANDAGKGVIVGVLDTGAWPEHPSFADHGNLATPPPKADGTPRACNFGDNPLTPASDPFVCSESSSRAGRSSPPTTPSSATRSTTSARD